MCILQRLMGSPITCMQGQTGNSHGQVYTAGDPQGFVRYESEDGEYLLGMHGGSSISMNLASTLSSTAAMSSCLPGYRRDGVLFA